MKNSPRIQTVATISALPNPCHHLGCITFYIKIMRLYQVEGGGGADFEKLKIVVLWGHFLTLSSIFQVAATCHHQKF